MLKNLLYKWLLPKILSTTPKEKSTPLSDKTNFYTFTVQSDPKKKYFLAKEYKEEQLKGFAWDDNGKEQCSEENRADHTMELSELLKTQYSIEIIHFYYDIDKIVDKSIYRFAFHRITKIVYLQIYCCRVWNAIGQWFFNKKKIGYTPIHT